MWAPAAGDVIANVALPLLSRLEAPSTVAPSLKVTDPPGMPEPPPVAVTVAASKILWPKVPGFGVEFSEITVGLWDTVCAMVDVELAKLVVP